jgi:hypothetical protein
MSQKVTGAKISMTLNKPYDWLPGLSRPDPSCALTLCKYMFDCLDARN